MDHQLYIPQPRTTNSRAVACSAGPVSCSVAVAARLPGTSSTVSVRCSMFYYYIVLEETEMEMMGGYQVGHEREGSPGCDFFD